MVRLERAGQGGVNSGRAVASSSTRAVGLCAIRCPSSSSVDDVAPVQVLDEQDQRLRRAQGQVPLRQQVDRLAPLQLGAHLQRRGRRQTEKVGEQGHGLR